MNTSETSKKNFGLINYWKMFKARGIRLPISYFLNAHLFDLIHKTETHSWVQKQNFEQPPENFDHGVLYMCSWTSEVIKSFRKVRSLLGHEFQNFSFLDIGSGKGKVVLVWKLNCLKKRINQKICGIDYYKPFIQIANLNYQTIFKEAGPFSFEDATNIDFQKYGDKLIIYLYNPFDEIILEKVLQRVSDLFIIVIYNNPVHSNVLLAKDYKIIYHHKGFHPNAETIIYTNRPLL